MQLNEEAKLHQIEDSARRLLNSNSDLISAVLSHITETALQDFIASGPEDTAAREAAHRRINAVQEIDQLIRNLATASEARKQAAIDKLNPA